MKTQNELIKRHLENGMYITPIEALNYYGCFRLGARINDLRNTGLDIKTEIIGVGKKHFARYCLKSVWDAKEAQYEKNLYAECDRIFA